MLFFHLADENEAEMKEKAAEDEDDSGNSDEEEDDDDGVITEIRFVPSDKTACECSHKPEQQPDEIEMVLNGSLHEGVDFNARSPYNEYQICWREKRREKSDSLKNRTHLCRAQDEQNILCSWN